MTQVTLILEPNVARFDHNIAVMAGKPFEQVLADALFMLAGELSLEALGAPPLSNPILPDLE